MLKWCSLCGWGWWFQLLMQSRICWQQVKYENVGVLSIGVKSLQSFRVKGSYSTSMPCRRQLLVGICCRPFLWAMKMATAKANQETTRARNARWNRHFKAKFSVSEIFQWAEILFFMTENIALQSNRTLRWNDMWLFLHFKCGRKTMAGTIEDAYFGIHRSFLQQS